MSTYAQFENDGNQYQFASNLGWSEFGDWIDKLDHEDHPNLVALWEHGVSENVKSLTSELEKALKDNPPSKEVSDSAELLLSALHQNQDAGFILTTK